MSLLSQLLPKKDGADFFLTLGVEEHHIRAAVSAVMIDRVELIGTGESDYAEGRDETEAADIAVTTAEKNLPSDILVEQVVFALPQSQLIEGKINPDYVTRLKTITKALNLKAHGFVEYPEAISFFLEKQEGAAPTVLLLSIERHQLVFSLIKLGKVIETVSTPRTESITDDMVSAIPKFTSSILPSRILIYDNAERLEDIQESLVKLPWHKHNAFLHTPKIEIMQNEDVIRALVEAASSSFIPKSNDERTMHATATVPPETSKTPEEVPTVPEVIQETAPPIVESSEPQDPTPKPIIPPIVPSVSQESKSIPEETFGFTREDTVSPQMEMESNLVVPKKSPLPLPVSVQQEEHGSTNDPLTKVSSLFRIFTFIPDRIKSTVMPIVIIVGLLIAGVFFVWSYPKASVHLITYPLLVTQTTDATFSVASQDSLPDDTIAMSPLTEDVNGEKTIATTGRTRIGERAKGEVIVYNKTVARRDLPKGSVLQKGNLLFTLDDAVSIASASETGEGLIFGKSVARITASSIGPDSNVPAQTAFVFKDFSENLLTAKNTANFSGGTSREVGSVSKDDQTKLEAALTDMLIAKANQQISLRRSPDEELLTSAVDTSVVAKKFSAEIGQEAHELSLSLSLKVTTYSVNRSRLLTVTHGVPVTSQSGFSKQDGRTVVRVTEAKPGKSGVIKAKVAITDLFLPSFDIEIIRTNLVGKTYDEAATYLQSINHVAGVKIIREASFPFLSRRLPFSKNNLTVTITQS
jgi:hypothetical protein